MNNRDSAGSLRWIPHAVSGLGVILGLIVIGEWVAHMTFSGSLPDVFLTGIATSIPFIEGVIEQFLHPANRRRKNRSIQTMRGLPATTPSAVLSGRRCGL